MSEQDDGIAIDVSMDTDEAEQGTLLLARAIQTLTGAVGALAPKVERAKTAEEQMAAAAASAAQAQQLAATQAIALGQRIAGAASAVQGLVGQLGGQSRTAGLVGASIQTSVQFAQLGLMLGPGGALVGGILGAAIPAISALREEMEVARSTIDDTAQSIEALTTAYVAAGEAAELQARLASGTATLEEATTSATQAQALYNDEATRHHTLLAVALDDAERELASRSAVFDALDIGYQAQTIAARQAVADAREELEASEALTESLRAEAVQRLAVSDAMARQAVATRTGNAAQAEARAAGHVVAPRRGGGGSSGMSDEKTNVLAKMDEERAEAARLAEEASQAAIASEADLNEWLVRNAAEYSHRATQAEQRHQVELQMHEEDLAAQIAADEKAKEAMAEHTRAVSEETQGVASALINSMTDVISQMAEGNATAEEGAQLMLAAFLQMISQRAQIEALAQVAQAIGSYPDVGGIAAHAAAALAWGAVAVATGVGASAVSSGVARAQAARQEAERPASPRSGGVSEGKGGSTTIINWNGPVVTSQTTAGLGRGLREMIGVSGRRFPGSV